MRIAFGLASPGELQFLQPILCALDATEPAVDLVMLHEATTDAECAAQRGLPKRLRHDTLARAAAGLAGPIDLFVTSEQYQGGLREVFSVCVFHGQPSKGVTFTEGILDSFDAFFLYGPLHREALSRYLSRNALTLPETLQLFDVGYPKSDALLNGAFSREAELNALKLDPSRRTVLYAPAFNEGASLREWGPEIVETLAKDIRSNVIVKLPIDCWRPTSDLYATGGVDWFQRLAPLEARFPNLRLCLGYEIDPFLACADVLVTCVSSVGFEFLALGRPVVFIDTPKFFSQFLARRLGGTDNEVLANCTTVNGGREFGLVVGRVAELPGAVDEVLSLPDLYPRQRERLRWYLLYNRGQAASATARLLGQMVRDRVRTRRGTLANNRLLRRARRTGEIVRRGAMRAARQFANAAGYSITRTGAGYLDASETVARARASALSVGDYLERRDLDPRKIGRRRRIIEEMQRYGALQAPKTVVELGPGAGQFLERVLQVATPVRYEFYETDPGWKRYLMQKYGHLGACELVPHHADGVSMSATRSESVDLVHAHAVFVYLPFLQVLEYLREAVRVTRRGASILFDCFTEAEFSSLDQAEFWLGSQHRFPSILPRSLLDEFVVQHGLLQVAQFEVPYGPTNCRYFVLRRT